MLEGDHVLSDPDGVHATRLGLACHRGEELRRGERIGRGQPDVEVHRCYLAAGVVIRNTGCSGAMRRSSSSDESAETPSKNFPTSNFQRRR